MDGPGLSEPERLILAEIERDLRADALLDRRLRTMSPGPPLARVTHGFRSHLLAAAVCVLAALTCVLLVMAASTSAPGLIWAFATTWALTLVGLLVLVCRWSKRLAGRRRERGGERDSGPA
ncbi:DUF3040 domain-containing protein [Streptomyces peucetius]|uniref:DUF3040 domain-containing protein n=1 Tax=Streptomyces peucetius TaxID=1950 RepID=A0ABY6I0I0_STRPE|nr:DUF3040 domain-containing protein [Streptomyces peucetius]UYQ60477.1 DUF3040 domain-containing protein [Streptomyces peucetius]